MFTMKNMILLLIALLVFPFSLDAKRKLISMRDYGVVPHAQQLSQKLQDALIAIHAEVSPKDRVTLKFDSGEYHFHEEGSFTREYYISNHDQDNPKHVAFALENWSNLTLDGQGSEFLFHGQMIPVSLLNSTNVTLKNFSIDFVNPHITQVEIITNDPTEGIVFKPASWTQTRIGDKGRLEAYGDGWTSYPMAGIAFEKDTRHILYNTSDLYFDSSDLLDLEDGSYLAPHWKDSRLVEGTIVAMRTWDRPTPGIFLSESKNTKLQNIQVHYAQGMGLLAQVCEDILLDGFSVALKGEKDPRYFTAQADATHFSGCKGKIISKNGLYEGMMDDAINVHGTYLKISERLGDYTLVAEYMHEQSWGFKWGEVGDDVQFIRSNTMEYLEDKNKITRIEPVDASINHGVKKFKIIFANSLSSDIDTTEAMGIENLTWTPEVVFSNNTVRNNRARGALFSTPKPVLVENNLFDHTSGTAILLCGDCNGWYETGACRNVVIRKNHFVNALTNMFQFTNAVISINPEIPNLKGQEKYFHGGKKGAIRIEKNTFETFDEPLLYAKSVDGLVFKKNKVIKNNEYKPFHWNKQKVLLERVINAEIEE